MPCAPEGYSLSYGLASCVEQLVSCFPEGKVVVFFVPIIALSTHFNYGRRLTNYSDCPTISRSAHWVPVITSASRALCVGRGVIMFDGGLGCYCPGPLA